jgi:hypothetical protein
MDILKRRLGVRFQVQQMPDFSGGGQAAQTGGLSSWLHRPQSARVSPVLKPYLL